MGLAASSRFRVTSMTTTPTKETMSPITFIAVSRSLRKKRAAMGVTKGIMAMMPEPMTGELFFNP